MKRKITLLSLLLCTLAWALSAQTYPESSYKLSEDKKTLTQWSGDEETIDLTKDTAFDAVEIIGDGAFRARRDLREIVLPNSCREIRGEAFADCNMLQKISWSDHLESIGEESFLACKNLQSVDFKKVTSIGGSAFSGCAKLKRVTLPKTLETLGEYAFYNCRQLAHFEVEKGCEAYFAVSGVLYSDLLGSWYLEQYPRAKTDEEFVIPFTVLGTAARAFDNCKSIKRLYIPQGMSRFNTNAFFNCTGLEEIYSYRSFPPEVIGTDALHGVNVEQCKLYVPEEAIEQYKTADGWKLFKQILPMPQETGVSRMSYIYDGASNTLIRFIGTMPELDMTKDPVLSKTEYIADEAIKADKLSNVTLLSLVLADGIKELGEAAIWATELRDLKLNDKLEVMNEASISGAKITKLALPASLRSFAPCAIYNAFHLETITLSEENPTYEVRDNLLIEKATNSLLFMPNGRQGGRTIHLPSGIRAVSDKAVYNDICVQELILDEGFEEIGVSAFSQCFSLVYLDLPATVKTLKNNAFKGNNALSTVIIRATTPPEATPKGSAGGYRTEGTFDQLPDTATLYVPKESIEAYKKVPAYAEAFAQIKPLEEAPLPTNCQRPLAPDVQITTADGMLSVTAEGQISIYDLTGTLRSSGSNALRMVSTTGETLLVVIQGGDTTLVRKVIVR